MTHEEKNWSDALLNAHFKSLNQAWSDRNSVMLLLAEVRDLLGSDRYRNDTAAQNLKKRIELFTSSAATRVDRQPMMPAGKKPGEQEGRKTG
jgi:hypothetical protein